MRVEVAGRGHEGVPEDPHEGVRATREGVPDVREGVPDVREGVRRQVRGWRG